MLLGLITVSCLYLAHFFNCLIVIKRDFFLIITYSSSLEENEPRVNQKNEIALKTEI